MSNAITPIASYGKSASLVVSAKDIDILYPRKNKSKKKESVKFFELIRNNIVDNIKNVRRHRTQMRVMQNSFHNIINKHTIMNNYDPTLNIFYKGLSKIFSDMIKHNKTSFLKRHVTMLHISEYTNSYMPLVVINIDEIVWSYIAQVYAKSDLLIPIVKFVFSELFKETVYNKELQAKEVNELYKKMIQFGGFTDEEER